MCIVSGSESATLLMSTSWEGVVVQSIKFISAFYYAFSNLSPEVEATCWNLLNCLDIHALSIQYSLQSITYIEQNIYTFNSTLFTVHIVIYSLQYTYSQSLLLQLFHLKVNLPGILILSRNKSLPEYKLWTGVEDFRKCISIILSQPHPYQLYIVHLMYKHVVLQQAAPFTPRSTSVSMVHLYFIFMHDVVLIILNFTSTKPEARM